MKQNPFQIYKASSSKKLPGDLLDQAHESTEQNLALLLAAATKCGSKIASDGRSDAQCWPILNFQEPAYDIRLGVVVEHRDWVRPEAPSCVFWSKARVVTRESLLRDSARLG